MPIVAVGVERLNRLLGGPERGMEALVEALENLGCDVEDTAEMIQYQCPVCEMLTERLVHEAAPRRCDHCEHEQPRPLLESGRRSVIRLDLLADRPDLFDAGGISRALKGLLGIERGLPRYTVEPGTIRVEVDPALEKPGSYWPNIAAAELELPSLDQEGLRELMRLQESLHWGIGRDRKLCSIGVYDLDSIQPPIRFTRIEPEGRRFVPLHFGTAPMTARQILTEHPKGKAYASLLEGFVAYPLLIDSKDQVLSMPPVINSEETRVHTGTRRLFAEVTGTVEAAVRSALHTLVCSMAELGATIRGVRIIRPSGEEQSWPQIAPRSRSIDLEDARRWLGLDLPDAALADLLQKMRLDVDGSGRNVTVSYPAFRTDIRHPVDLYADLAIGHGYGSYPMKLVPTMTPSSERPEERISSRVRAALIGQGFWEILSLVQTTAQKHFTRLRLEPGDQHAIIANPKNVEVNIVRCHLLTGILETLEKNRRKAAPQQFFEVGNIVLLAPGTETGTREERRVCFAVLGPEAGYAQIRSTADALCRELGAEPVYSAEVHPTFVSGRCATIDAKGRDGLQLRGRLGELHPEVLERFGLQFPVALAEISLCDVV